MAPIFGHCVLLVAAACMAVAVKRTDLLAGTAREAAVPLRPTVLQPRRLTWQVAPNIQSLLLHCCFRYAAQEAKISLVRLYQHQTYRLLPGQVPLALQQNLTLSPKNGVKVQVVPRA
jgi:hypothetical protein